MDSSFSARARIGHGWLSACVHSGSRSKKRPPGPGCVRAPSCLKASPVPIYESAAVTPSSSPSCFKVTPGTLVISTASCLNSFEYFLPATTRLHGQLTAFSDVSAISGENTGRIGVHIRTFLSLRSVSIRLTIRQSSQSSSTLNS